MERISLASWEDDPLFSAGRGDRKTGRGLGGRALDNTHRKEGAFCDCSVSPLFRPPGFKACRPKEVHLQRRGKPATRTLGAVIRLEGTALKKKDLEKKKRCDTKARINCH